MPSMESGSKATDIGQNSLMLNIILRHKVQFKKNIKHISVQL